MTLEAVIEVRRDGFEVRAAFEARAGETVAMLGPNGAGKSTIVAALAGLVPLEAGTVRLAGRPLDDAGSRVHVAPEERPIGVVFQDLLLFPHLSALENVAFPLRARRTPRETARARAAELLHRLGIAHRASARPAALSGGEAQRVALARALVAEPDLLLLDEPMSSLDVRARSEIRPLLREVLGRFSGVRVLVTHDPVEALTLADRLVIVEAGRVTQSGSPDEIRRSPGTTYVADLVGLNRFAGRLEPLDPGAGRLVTDLGEVVVAWPAGVAGAVPGVIGLLRPADVEIHVARPEGGSARNVLAGSVTAITLEAERGRIHVGTSPPVVAEITLGSVARLRLRQGRQVWVSFKAVEVRLELP